MSAVFSYDALTGPQYADLNGIAAGYGIVSVPVGGFLPGDQIQTVGLTIIGTGLTTIQLAVDMVQRTGGFYEWTDASSIDAHFTITAAQIAAIAAATNCTYSVVIMILRNGVQQVREVQAGAVSARAALPAPPLIVNSIVLTGGPVTGTTGQQAQLSATAYDGLGNAVPTATITWASTNVNVATVDATGRVTFVTPGVATISATSQGVTATTTATCNDAGLGTPTDKQALTYSSGLSSWIPATLTAAFIAITAGSLMVGGGWPSGAAELAPGAAGGYTRSNGSAWVRNAGVPASDVTAGTFGAGAYTFPSSLTVASGFTVQAGTAALQATTVTTLVASSTITGQLVNALTFGTHLSGTSYNNTGPVTIGVDATNLNTPSTMVARDGSGNFAAGTITAALAGNASTATAWQTARTIWGQSVDGTGNVSGALTIATGGLTVTLGGITVASGTTALQALTATTGNFSSTVTSTSFVGPLQKTLTFGAHLTGTSFNNSADVTLATDAASINTVSTLVARDGSGNFAAGTITAALTGNASTASAWQTARTIWGQSIDGSSNVSGALTVATGGITVTLGGLTVSAGTSALQATTTTTINASGLITASAGATVASGQTLTLTGATVAGSPTWSNAQTINTLTVGTSLTLTGATITGAPTWSSNQAITLSTAAQPNVTSVGTLTSITTSGALTFTAAASKIVPGATSFSHRNTADSADNLLITDAGAVTTRSTLTVSAGGATVTSGGLTVSAGTSAFQAVTATTGVFSSTLSAVGLSSSSGLTVSVGTSALQAVTATTLNVSGSITSSLGNNSFIFRSASATTGYNAMDFHNTSGWMVLGVEASAPAVLSGGTAYCTFLTSYTATDLFLGVNQNARLKIDGSSGLTTVLTGLAVSAGGLDLTGAPPAAAASHVAFGGSTRTTIGANGAATALTANPLGYLDINVGGTIAQIPYYNRGA